LILALDLYFRVPPWTISREHREIAKLSEDLNRLAAHTDVADAVRYRNLNGTYMKLMNFRSLDPSQDGRGLQGAGQNDRDVWAEYGHRPEEVKKVAAAIRVALNAPEISNATGIGQPDNDDITEAIEGAILTRLHRVRERNPKIVRAKKAQAIKRDGCLKCEACDFDFKVRYGDLGVEYIECHHRTPIAELPEHGKTRLEYLALVCSNCHRMLHRRKKWLTVEELRGIIHA
jgi:5-methylcytosine-specific restriction protein A